MSADKIKRISKDQIALESTVMAIREHLMEYFKGTCVERMTTNTNVAMQGIEGNAQYQYERIIHNNQNPKLLKIGQVPIAKVHKASDTIVIFTSVLDRSRQLRQVRRMLEEFMDDYLAGVIKEYSDANITTQ
jgi:hypothetical protein